MRMMLLVALGMLALSGRLSADEPAKKRSVKVTPFGTTADGTKVELYTLTNSHGVTAKVTTYGAILTELHVPDKDGKTADVVLGFDDLESYLKGHPFFGATVGRYANRIADAKFTLEGKEYKLFANNGKNSLHGGKKGFDKVVWKAKQTDAKDGVGVEFSYRSPDGEEGYPGNMDVRVTYTLTDANELRIDYSAKTDKTTVVNLTHHSYFNLAGHGSGDILSHEMMIDAEKYTPVNEGLIPTGKIEPVKGTPLDFTKATKIGDRIGELRGTGKDNPGGYDHNFVLKREGKGLELAAKVRDPKSGRGMEVWTTEPGIQFYSGNFLDGSNKGKDGAVYKKHAGFCLEAQHFPDSPNQPSFPSVVLKPGDEYTQTTTYKFPTK